MNKIKIAGELQDCKAEYKHTSNGKQIFSSTIEVIRTSGVSDELPLYFAEDNLPEETPLTIEGEIRTYNDNRHLEVYIFAKNLSSYKEDCNDVELEGYLCKNPIYRTTPKGLVICDILLAVNRDNGRSDYIPCICWNKQADKARHFNVGDFVRCTGRFQSRKYGKGDNAYEVSLYSIDLR